MSKKAGKKLVKTRGSRIDTVEAMDKTCGTCNCTYTCNNCSGGGSWTVQESTVATPNAANYNKRFAVIVL